MKHYEVNGTTSSFSAARTIAYLTAAAAQCLIVKFAKITAHADDTNEQIRAWWQRVNVLASPTRTDVTPRPIGDQDDASAFSAAIDVTAAEPTYVADTEIGMDGAPSLVGYRYPPPGGGEEQLEIRGGVSWGLRIAAVDTARAYTVKIVVGEVG